MNTSINDINFPVIEVPALLGNDIVTNTGHKFIVRKDTGKILSCMTDNYRLVENKLINKKSEKVIKKNGGILKEVQMFLRLHKK